MVDPRKQLEDATFQWFDDDISDKEYTEFANKYLTSRNFRLYKYQNPFASLESLDRFWDQLKQAPYHCVPPPHLMIPLTVNSPFLIGWTRKRYIGYAMQQTKSGELAA